MPAVTLRMGCPQRMLPTDRTRLLHGRRDPKRRLCSARCHIPHAPRPPAVSCLFRRFVSRFAGLRALLSSSEPGAFQCPDCPYTATIYKLQAVRCGDRRSSSQGRGRSRGQLMPAVTLRMGCPQRTLPTDRTRLLHGRRDPKRRLCSAHCHIPHAPRPLLCRVCADNSFRDLRGCDHCCQVLSLVRSTRCILTAHTQLQSTSYNLQAAAIGVPVARVERGHRTRLLHGRRDPKRRLCSARCHIPHAPRPLAVSCLFGRFVSRCAGLRALLSSSEPGAFQCPDCPYTATIYKLQSVRCGDRRSSSQGRGRSRGQLMPAVTLRMGCPQRTLPTDRTRLLHGRRDPTRQLRSHFSPCTLTRQLQATAIGVPVARVGGGHEVS